MAGVSRDRGQLVLVTAVAIAALLVLVAVLLNSVVYTENVATRGSTTEDARAAQLYRVAAVEAVDGLTQRANWGGASPDEFRANVTAWSNLQARHAATTGASANVTVRSMSTERTIRQNESGAMTNGTDDSWALVSNESTVDSWTLTVDEESLVAPASTGTVDDLEASGAFRVVVSNETTTWRAFVYRNDSEVEIRVDENGTLTQPCAAPSDASGTVTVDFLAREIGATPTSCTQLGFGEVVGPLFAISYENGNAATGTYELVVPHVSDVYVDVRYTSASLQYVVRNVSVDAEVDS